MSAFDLVSGEADARLRDLMRQPESVPGTFSGFWGAVGNAMVAAPLESARALSPVLDAYGKSAAFAQGGAKEDTIDRIGENDLRAELTPAINRLTPDPRVSGAASQLVFGFGKVAGKAIGYSMAGGNLAGAALFGLDEGVNETMRLEDKGADTGTAAKAGAVHGVVSGVSALLPVAGKTKLQTAGIVVAGGPASYVAEQATIKEILRSAQYDRIAEEYRPFDPVGLAVSTAAPAVFGTVAHLRMLRGESRGIRNNNPGNLVKSDVPWNGKLPGGDKRFESFQTAEQADAARVAYLAAHADSGNLGRAGDIEAANAHIQAIEEAARMLDDGDPVNVSHLVNVEPGKLDDMQAFVALAREEFGTPAADSQGVPFQDVRYPAAARFASASQDIINGLSGAGTALERLRNANPARFDAFVGQVQSAISKIDELRAAGKPIYDYLQNNPTAPEVHNLLVGFEEAAGNPKRVAVLLARYAELAGDAQGRKDFDLIADVVDGARNDPGLDSNVKLAGATPEQRAFYQSLLDQPNKEIPTGELDESGRPIVRRAVELMDEAELHRMKADEQVRGIDAAIHCLLRG